LTQYVALKTPVVMPEEGILAKLFASPQLSKGTVDGTQAEGDIEEAELIEEEDAASGPNESSGFRTANDDLYGSPNPTSEVH